MRSRVVIVVVGKYFTFPKAPDDSWASRWVVFKGL